MPVKFFSFNATFKSGFITEIICKYNPNNSFSSISLVHWNSCDCYKTFDSFLIDTIVNNMGITTEDAFLIKISKTWDLKTIEKLTIC